jgi:hypothetical protein
MTSEIKLIGITGRKFSGKDTLGNFLVNEYGYERMAYADALKECVRAIFDFDDDQLYGSRKEEIDDYWQLTPRQVLQFVGTDLFRNHIHELMPEMGKNIWINVLKRKISNKLKKNPNVKIVVTDIRFPNELDTIKELGGITIKLERNNLLSSDTHESEILIDNLKTDYVLSNNSTVEQLYNTFKNDIYNKI